jgi:hypothetical protein
MPLKAWIQIIMVGNIKLYFFRRQTLLHWAYELTKEDFEKGAKKIK